MPNKPPLHRRTRRPAAEEPQEAGRVRLPFNLRDTSVAPLHRWRRILGLPKNTLLREVRLGRLRVCKRSGRYFAFGAWIREWLLAGEHHGRGAKGETADQA